MYPLYRAEICGVEKLKKKNPLHIVLTPRSLQLIFQQFAFQRFQSAVLTSSPTVTRKSLPSPRGIYNLPRSLW